MIVRCPECGSKGKLDDSYTGSRVSCPECKVIFIAEEAGDSEIQKKWYYADGEDKKGPVENNAFTTLVNNGTIGPETLVWSKGMAGWQPLAETDISFETADVELVDCEECGGSFPPEKMMDHSGKRACEKCKLALLQKKQEQEEDMEEADGLANGLENGGLLSRFMAKIIDLVFMLAIGGIVEGISRRFFYEAYRGGAINDVFTVTLLINMLLGIFYITWFVGRFGATPGKMVAKLKIVNINGDKIGYGQAFGRYCGEFIVVALTFLIGYFIAVFDKKRRTLHDRLCRTWVVRSN